MAPPIGFVILSHNLPEQTARLCHRLNAMFGAPPIALHHDFGKCEFDRSLLPPNVHFVEPWISTGWGVFSIVEANREALRCLYAVGDPDWCVSISPSDYPIKSAERILTELRETTYDGFMDFREIVRPRLPPGSDRENVQGPGDPVWMEIAYERYIAKKIYPFPYFWRFHLPDKNVFIDGPLVERFLTPFSKTFRPYGGEYWYTLNRRAANVLLSSEELFARMRKYYFDRWIPDESVFHTILCNRSDLHLKSDPLRYTHWAAGARHPSYLGAADIPAALATSAHFARKFHYEPNLLDQIDRIVDSQPA